MGAESPARDRRSTRSPAGRSRRTIAAARPSAGAAGSRSLLFYARPGSSPWHALPRASSVLIEGLCIDLGGGPRAEAADMLALRVLISQIGGSAQTAARRIYISGAPPGYHVRCKNRRRRTMGPCRLP